MSQFTVSGEFEGRDGPQPFDKRVEAPNESVAREYVFSRIGSHHGLKRRQIDVSEVTAR